MGRFFQFNFAKEYLSRYVGNEKNKINMAGEVEMSEEAKMCMTTKLRLEILCCNAVCNYLTRTDGHGFSLRFQNVVVVMDSMRLIM